MADAAVEFLLENLQQQLLHHAHLIKDAKDLVERLENHLRVLKDFLKDVPKQRREDEEVTELIRRIRNAVYEAGDIIDAYVTQAAEAKNKNYFHGAIGGPPNIVTVVHEFEAIIRKIDCIYTHNSRTVDFDFDFAQIKAEEGRTNDEKIKKRQIRETKVVGFEDETDKLIGYLTEETNEVGSKGEGTPKKKRKQIEQQNQAGGDDMLIATFQLCDACRDRIPVLPVSLLRGTPSSSSFGSQNLAFQNRNQSFHAEAESRISDHNSVGREGLPSLRQLVDLCVNMMRANLLTQNQFPSALNLVEEWLSSSQRYAWLIYLHDTDASLQEKADFLIQQMG